MTKKGILRYNKFMDKKTSNALISLIITSLIVASIFWIANIEDTKPLTENRESIFSFSVKNEPSNIKSNNQIPVIEESKIVSQDIISNSIKKVITSTILPDPVSVEESVKEPNKDILEEIKVTPQTKTLSEAEVFSKLWPNYYLNHLKEIQNYLLEQNLITESSSFENQAEIYNFLNLYLTEYKTLANLTDEEFNDLQNKINNSKNIKQTQREAIIGDISFLKIFNNLIKTAEASYVTGAFWYKDDAPGNASPGISSPNTCGNCGIEIRRGTDRFHQNCGSYGVLCDIHLGCLNGTCRAFPNAIWDPSTTMCGCG